MSFSDKLFSSIPKIDLEDEPRTVGITGFNGNDNDNDNIKGIEDKDICTKCGGQCCKTRPCNCYPQDFDDLTYGGLSDALNSGSYSLDYYSVYDNHKCVGMKYYIRARIKDANICDDLSLRGVCTNLTETGCKFDFSTRPTGGRALIPDKDGRCIQPFNNKHCADAWEPYQSILVELWVYFEQFKTYPD